MNKLKCSSSHVQARIVRAIAATYSTVYIYTYISLSLSVYTYTYTYTRVYE